MWHVYIFISDHVEQYLICFFVDCFPKVFNLTFVLLCHCHICCLCCLSGFNLYRGCCYAVVDFHYCCNQISICFCMAVGIFSNTSAPCFSELLSAPCSVIISQLFRFFKNPLFLLHACIIFIFPTAMHGSIAIYSPSTNWTPSRSRVLMFSLILYRCLSVWQHCEILPFIIIKTVLSLLPSLVSTM